jgi:hypothetical protein
VTLGDLERTETHANLFGFLVQTLREVWTDVATVADSSSTRSFDTGSDSALLDDSADEPAHMDMASAPSTRPSSRSARRTERTALPAARSASTVSFDVFAAHLESTSLFYAHSAVFVWPVEPPEERSGHGFSFEFGPLDATSVGGLGVALAAVDELPPPADSTFGWVTAAWPRRQVAVSAFLAGRSVKRVWRCRMRFESAFTVAGIASGVVEVFADAPYALAGTNCHVFARKLVRALLRNQLVPLPHDAIDLNEVASGLADDCAVSAIHAPS